MRIPHANPTLHPTPPAPIGDDELKGWFAGRLPEGLFAGPPAITTDRDEILVVGEIADVELEKGTSDAARSTARAARIDRFRGETREARMAVAREAERLFG